MHSLPIFLRLRDRPVILLGEGEAADAKRRLLERVGARIISEHEAASIAVVALENDADAAVARLRARGILVNATDRPDLCDFTLPAIVDRDPVLVAIGTGGASAGLAKALRQRLERMLPQRLGGLANALHAARVRLRERWPDGGNRRRAIDDALAEGGVLDPLRDGSDGGVDDWLSTGRAAEAARRETIALRSADPDLLTLRDARLLGQADRIHHAIEVPPAILSRARADAVRLPLPTPDDPLPGLTLIVRWERP